MSGLRTTDEGDEPACRLAVGYSGKCYDRLGSSIGSVCESCAKKLPLPPRCRADPRCSHCSRPTFLNQEPQEDAAARLQLGM
jgi:hypothetical protein